MGNQFQLATKRDQRDTKQAFPATHSPWDHLSGERRFKPCKTMAGSREAQSGATRFKSRDKRPQVDLPRLFSRTTENSSSPGLQAEQKKNNIWLRGVWTRTRQWYGRRRKARQLLCVFERWHGEVQQKWGHRNRSGLFFPGPGVFWFQQIS